MANLKSVLAVLLQLGVYCGVNVVPVHGLVVCTKVNDCACETPAGKIDLSPLANNNNTPKFKDKFGLDNWYYSWNPCNPFLEGSGECSSVAGCQTDLQSQYFSLGAQTSAKFGNDPATGAIQIEYSASVTTPRSLYVTLVCDNSSQTTTIKAQGESPVGSAMYYMTLTSPYCCPGGGGSSGGGLSIGTVLLIVFIVVTFVYTVGGVVFQVFVRKSSGKDVVPNFGFWSALPGLIMAGTKFVFFCGKRDKYSGI